MTFLFFPADAVGKVGEPGGGEPKGHGVLLQAWPDPAGPHGDLSLLLDAFYYHLIFRPIPGAAGRVQFSQHKDSRAVLCCTSAPYHGLPSWGMGKMGVYEEASW